MVALTLDADEPTRRDGSDSTPLLWQVLTTLDSALVALSGKLSVTGSLPHDWRGRAPIRGRATTLRGQPMLLAANHIGVYDAFVLIAACHKLGVEPKFLIAGGIMDAPVVGAALRASGHLRVDRGKSTVVEAFSRAVDALRTSSDPILVYPEGRISHEPGLWPERGKSGVARLALAAGVPVVPISQWGAHEAAYWGTETVGGWADFQPVAASWLRGVVRRPTYRVHFGAPVDLSGLSVSRAGDAVRARDRIMRAITDGLVPLRRHEPDKPNFYDPTRPTDSNSPWRP